MADTNVTIQDVARLIVQKDTWCTPGGNSWQIRIEQEQRDLEATFAEGYIKVRVADKPSLT